jgi:hypothetical protein
MREVRYTRTPPLSVLINLAMLVAAAACVVPLLRQLVRDVYSNSFAGNMKIAILCLAFIYAVRGIMTWVENRNQLAFILGPAGIWTEKTGWLAWPATEFTIDQWRDTVSVAYEQESATHLLRWPLSALDSNRVDLLKSCQEYKAMAG